MPTHILNFFEISNACNLSVEYRLVDVDGPFNAALRDGEIAERNQQQLLQRIAFEEKIPVALFSGGEKPVLTIPAAHDLSTAEYHLAPDVATLQPRPERHWLSLGAMSDDAQRRVGLAFLGWHIRSALRTDRRLWSAGTWTYFSRRPLNYKHHDRYVDVFGGFGLRLAVRQGRVGLWVRLTHRYVESAWMPDVYTEHEMQEMLRMRHALYHYGHRWYRVQFLGPTHKSIAEQRFVLNGSSESISIYDYTVREVGGARAPAWIKSLDPHSPAITYQNPGNKQKRYGAAALCKMMRATDDPRVSRLHHFSLKAPERRFEEMGRVVETFLRSASFDGEPIHVRTSPERVRRKVFPVPPQEFGQGQTLHVGRDASAGEIRLQDLGRKRMETLLDPEAGLAVNQPLDAQYLIAPASTERKVVEDFQKRLEQTTRDILQRSFSFNRVVYQDQNARTLKQQVDAIMAAIDKSGVGSGRGILMLPARAESDLHNFLKKNLQHRLQFQCVNATKVAEFYELKPQNGKAIYRVASDLNNRYVSYLRYTAMGLLIVNRQWPWVLATSTHYDMYIGVDVLHGTAAFTFFAEGGRECFLHSVESQQKEKLLRKQVRSVIYEQLKEYLTNGGKRPRSIVLRRDGRSFGSERQGFFEAITRLINDGLLDADIVRGVVEVHKTSAEGIRLVEELMNGQLRNPTVGAWEEIGEGEGVVCTTGFPFKFRGTVKPLVVRVAAGDLSLEFVLEDTFAMSQLCWPVPDRCMRLSIDLKLCDDYLRSIAVDADEDAGQFGDDDEKWAEREERVAEGEGT